MLTLGAKPDQIIFANPCKQSSHIRYARDNNVKLLVFDNEEELFKIKKDFPDAKFVLIKCLLPLCQHYNLMCVTLPSTA